MANLFLIKTHTHTQINPQYTLIELSLATNPNRKTLTNRKLRATLWMEMAVWDKVSLTYADKGEQEMECLDSSDRWGK